MNAYVMNNKAAHTLEYALCLCEFSDCVQSLALKIPAAH